MRSTGAGSKAETSTVRPWRSCRDALGRTSAAQVAALIRDGRVLREARFDRFLPPELRRVSSEHWTPLAVAARVAHWIECRGIRKVIDLGSGVGKLCVATALGTSRCQFVGIEQRPSLVRIARALATDFGVAERVQFIEGDLSRMDIPAADGYYVYNPFAENVCDPQSRVDQEVELSLERFDRDMATVQTLLMRAPVGTYLIKYNKYGALVPTCYDAVLVDRSMPELLCLWEKVRSECAATEEA